MQGGGVDADGLRRLAEPARHLGDVGHGHEVDDAVAEPVGELDRILGARHDHPGGVRVADHAVVLLVEGDRARSPRPGRAPAPSGASTRTRAADRRSRGSRCPSASRRSRSSSSVVALDVDDARVRARRLVQPAGHQRDADRRLAHRPRRSRAPHARRSRSTPSGCWRSARSPARGTAGCAASTPCRPRRSACRSGTGGRSRARPRCRRPSSRRPRRACVTGWSGSSSIIVRTIAIAVNGSLDGTLIRQSHLVSAECDHGDRGHVRHVAGDDVHVARPDRADARARARSGARPSRPGRPCRRVVSTTCSSRSRPNQFGRCSNIGRMIGSVSSPASSASSSACCISGLRS